jgi:aminomethyltransferase
LDAADGSVVDNIIVWWLAEERFWVLPNASNNEAVVAATVVALPFVRG